MKPKIEIKVNHVDECYDLIDVANDQSHDGDGARELIAKVYDRSYAAKIANLLSDNTPAFQCHNGED